MRSLDSAPPKLRKSALISTPLLLSYLLSSLLYPHHACAATQDSVTYKDHNHPRSLHLPEVLELRGDEESYEPDFIGADRSIIGRALADDKALANNAPTNTQINQGESDFWTFPSQALAKAKSPKTSGLPSTFPEQYNFPPPNSSDGTLLFISLTTCLQPTPESSKSNGAPDQLKLYVSTSSSNPNPSINNNDHAVPVDGGFGWLNISVKSDVYFGVFAPNNDGFDGIYNYQLTASIDGFFASYHNETQVYFVDSDTNSALLYTYNLTNENSSSTAYEAWMSTPPAFSMFVQNQDNPAILGLQKSYCALEKLAQIQMTDIDTAVTSANNGQPQQLFHAKTLNGSSSYYAMLALNGNSTQSGGGIVGGGGVVWNTVKFETKSDNNCALVYNLPFCSSIAYAAPWNPTNGNFSNTTNLGLHYDSYASSVYKNFSRSLAQIPCNTTSSAQYSLAVTCDDCAAAYKEWLCAVSIPRCEDFSNSASYLQPRAIAQPFTNTTYGDQYINDPTFSAANKSRAYYNQSRNSMIDTEIKPGPYKEVLPCEDLCYKLVRSCPAALKFACPPAGHGFNYTYGKPTNLSFSPPTCNSPKTGISGAAALTGFGALALHMTFGTALMVLMI